MALYGGIDLHGNNNYLCLIDDKDQPVLERRLSNELSVVLEALRPHRRNLKEVAVESTYNWYWLVDGLMSAGYRVSLSNPAAAVQYSGLKYADDKSDARWLAHMLRLGILPTGYIYPREQRPVRDLLRKRSQLVRMKSQNMLSAKSLLVRSSGLTIQHNRIKDLDDEDLMTILDSEELALAARANINVMKCLDQEIKVIERTVLKKTKGESRYEMLETVDGIGKILSLTIGLETGEIGRFKHVGNFASYCRCVSSIKTSNGKKKGEGNTKNGNKYLAWAFVEAANFAIRYSERINRYYQRKQSKAKASKSRVTVARKTIAHKLARACYFIMRDNVQFDVERAFA